MKIVQKIVALLALLLATSSAVAVEEVVVDGQRFVNKAQFEPASKPKVLAPGETFRVNQKCSEEKEKRSVFFSTWRCVWDQTVVGTESGAPQVIEGGSEQTEEFREDPALILSSIMLLIITLILYKNGCEYQSIGTLIMSILSSTFGVVTLSNVMPIIVYFVLVGAYALCIKMKKSFFPLAGVHITLMTILFFMVI